MRAVRPNATRKAAQFCSANTAHVECYNRRELATDPGVRDDWGRGFARMSDLMYQHDGCLGGAIWAGIDEVFCLPNGKFIGYGMWGSHLRRLAPGQARDLAREESLFARSRDCAHTTAASARRTHPRSCREPI